MGWKGTFNCLSPAVLEWKSNASLIFIPFSSNPTIHALFRSFRKTSNYHIKGHQSTRETSILNWQRIGAAFANISDQASKCFPSSLPSCDCCWFYLISLEDLLSFPVMPYTILDIKKIFILLLYVYRGNKRITMI